MGLVFRYCEEMASGVEEEDSGTDGGSGEDGFAELVFGEEFVGFAVFEDVGFSFFTGDVDAASGGDGGRGEAGAAAAHGLARDEALKAITLYPAQILGVADKLGSLETGKLASFFVADGDPLDIRTQVERIFIQGREIELSDRQTKLNDKYQQKYLQLKK